MDAQLKEIIDTIQNEGVQTAEKKAAEIVGTGEERAAQIVKDAEKRAQEIVRTAQAEAERYERTGKDNLAQAGRDLVLNVETRLKRLFQRVLEQTTREAYSTEVLQQAIIALVQADSDATDLTVQIGSEAASAVERSLHAKFGETLKAGVTIAPIEGVDAGFRISEKEGNAYFDFTAAGIAELLGEYLNPRLADLLREATKE